MVGEVPRGGNAGDSAVGSPRYRCLVDMWSNVVPNGANCVEMLRNLCPVNPSMYYVGVSKVLSRKGLLENLRCLGTSDVPWGLMVCSPKLFLKEQLYQALESKRARAHHLAALTLQRYARTFFIKKRFRSLRRKIVLLQSRARGYLARWSYGSVGWGGGGGHGMMECPPAGSATAA